MQVDAAVAPERATLLDSSRPRTATRSVPAPPRDAADSTHAENRDPRERRRRRFVMRDLRLLRFVRGERPAPLAWWTTARAVARRISPGADALLPSSTRIFRRGDALADADLGGLLASDRLGEFAPDAASLDWLARRFDVDRPRAILHVGAGVATLALARLAQRAARTGARCAVVAIEEGRRVVDAVAARLARAGLAADARVVLAPLDRGGRYGFDPWEIARLAGRPFDWVIVEGPVAAAGRRVHSLPDAATLCAETASWFLVDAFRDDRLDVLARWASTPGIEVRGVLPFVGNGLAVGRVRRSHLPR